MRLFRPEEFQSRRKKQGGIKISRIIVEKRKTLIDRVLSRYSKGTWKISVYFVVRTTFVESRLWVGKGREEARGLDERLLIFICRERGGASKFRRRKLEEKREARSVSLAVWSGHGMESSTRGHEWFKRASDRINVKYVRFLRVF